MSLSEQEKAVRLRLRIDLEHFAARCLKIRPKEGGLVSLNFNRAQRHLHALLEEQRAKTGRVRAIVLKGRQMGMSTYIASRFFHRASHAFGHQAFILTQEAQATANLFRMIQRFAEHVPDLVKPEIGASNARELFFAKLDSGFKVGTAGTEAVGRSATIQSLHSSEFAYWPNAEEHAAGILQAVPDTPGSEVILESTANGMGGLFHKKWCDAERGIGDYIPIFAPWYWSEEYSRPVPDDFTLTPEEADLQRSIPELTDGNLVWRRAKLAELGDEMLFKQEYPCTAAEAFQMTGHDAFIPPALVLRARKTADVDDSSHQALAIGYDPAGLNGRHAMAWRCGRKIEKVEYRINLDTTGGVGWVAEVINRDKPARVFIDVGGLGVGIYERLCQLRYGGVVTAVNLGSKPHYDSDKERGVPVNRRAEMWQLLKKMLEEGGSIPDSDALQADICAPGYRYNEYSQLVLEDKEHMRRRGIPSPDGADACALTFAEPVIGAGDYGKDNRVSRQPYAEDWDPLGRVHSDGNVPRNQWGGTGMSWPPTGRNEDYDFDPRSGRG